MNEEKLIVETRELCKNFGPTVALDAIGFTGVDAGLVAQAMAINLTTGRFDYAIGAGLMMGLAGCVYLSKNGVVAPDTGLGSSSYFMSAFLIYGSNSCKLVEVQTFKEKLAKAQAVRQTAVQ